MKLVGLLVIPLAATAHLHAEKIRRSGPAMTAGASEGVNMWRGCQILPADSIFNVPIDEFPTDAKSASWIQQSLRVGRVGISIAGMMDLNVVDNSTPLTKMSFHYTTALDGRKYPLPPKPDRSRETGSLTTDTNNDHHLIAINKDTCHIYETYQDGSTGNGWNAASGWDYDSYSYKLPSDGSTDAAGLPMTPLLAHLSEIEAGEIHHALRFTSCAGCISHETAWPAQRSTAYTAEAAPMGSRWRLKADFDVSRFSPKAQIFLNALKRYGMILADIGGIDQIQVASDVYLDPEITAALNQIQEARIDQSNFEIVDESSRRFSQTSSRAKGVPAAPETPPVGVGTPDSVVVAQVGAKYLLSGWVTGTRDEKIVWRLRSGPGTVRGGVFEVTEASVAGQSAIIQGTSAADSSHPALVTIRIIPAGAIRVDVGSSRPYTDRSGNVWHADTLGQVSGAFSAQDDSYPASAWTSVQDAGLYRSFVYTWGDDIMYAPFAVPNGKYIVTWYFAHGGCAGKYDPLKTFDNGLVNGSIMTEVNGLDTLYTPASLVCRTPDAFSRTLTVTAGIIRLGIRAVGGTNAHSAPYLNAFSIVPEPPSTAKVESGQ